MNTVFNNFIFDEVYADIMVGGYGGFGFSSLDTPPHRHSDYYEITYVTSGIYFHTYAEQDYALTPGTLLLMSPHSEHTLYPESAQASFFALCIREDYFLAFIKQHFPDFSTAVFPKCTTVNLDTTDLDYLEKLGQQMNTAKPSLYIADIITYLTLVNIFYKKRPAPKNTAQPVQRILSILNNPSNLHIQVAQLYAIADIPVPALIKAFKEQTGCTIIEYKRKKRMEYAADMLQNTDLKVITIANELHYDSLSYFLRSFKKEFGIPPTKYRKLHKK